MKRTRKRTIGFLGLILVVAVTIFAASLPNPTASAVSGLTDTITVQVVGSEPNVDLTAPEPNMKTVSPTQIIRFNHDNTEEAILTLKYTDKNGTEHEYTLQSYDLDYRTGEKTYNLNLNDYGYGEYYVLVSGEGYDDTNDEDSRSFSYYPVIAEAREDKETGLIYTDLNYKTEDAGGEVAAITINIYDESNNLVETLSPIAVVPPTTEVEIPFVDHDLPSGTYTVRVSAYDSNNEELYHAYILQIKYEAIPVPDTGGLFKNLNGPRVDYIIAGLVAFLALTLLGVILVLKKQKNSTRQR